MYVWPRRSSHAGGSHHDRFRLSISGEVVVLQVIDVDLIETVTLVDIGAGIDGALDFSFCDLLRGFGLAGGQEQRRKGAD